MPTRRREKCRCAGVRDAGVPDELGGGWVWDPQPPGLQHPAAIWELDVEKKTPTALGKVTVKRNAQTKSE